LKKIDFLIELEYQREGEKYIFGHYLYDIKKKEKKKIEVKPTKFSDIASLKIENLKKEIEYNKKFNK